MSIGVTLNLSRLHRVLARVAPDVIDRGAREWAEAVEEQAREIVPVDTGALRESIHIEGGDGSYKVVASMPYAGFVEYGTPHAPAQPFLTPALHNVRALPFFVRAFAELIR